MSFWPISSRRQRYSGISQDDVNISEESTKRSGKGGKVTRKHVVQGLLILVVWLSGILIGSRNNVFSKRGCNLSGTVPQVPGISECARQEVRHNASFEAPPPDSEAHEAAWDSLIPNGLGYIKHPVIAPNYSVIGVFHQLHCLYTIRRAYYSFSEGQENFDFGIERRPHVGHCFDYLRQSLMCHADINIEGATEKVNGNPNWGFERQCRSFEEVKKWAEEWRVFDGHGFLAADVNPKMPM